MLMVCATTAITRWGGHRNQHPVSMQIDPCTQKVSAKIATLALITRLRDKRKERKNGGLRPKKRLLKQLLVPKIKL
jgi:hypothetical protein